MHDNGPLRIVIAGGGTGGHLYPGVALAEAFQESGRADIMFIGTAYGLENKVLPGLPFKFRRIWIRGLERKLTPGNLLFPLRLSVSLLQCAAILLAFKPDVVVGTGGYVSGPALISALMFGYPAVIQEQNSYPGLVNRLLGKKVNQVYLTFEDSRKYFAGARGQLFVTGNPVRQGIAAGERKTAAGAFGLDPARVTLMIFGGSQGAHAINQVVLSALPALLSLPDLQILWVTGEREWQHLSLSCAQNGDRIKVHNYIKEMASAYAASDFVVCRSGASTLSEIALCGLPAILVPYPFAAANHQESNARSVEKAGAAIMLSEKTLTADSFFQAIKKLYRDTTLRQKMATAARGLARPDAAKEITANVRTVLNK